MMANILFSNIECLFLNLMIFNTKLSSLDGLVSFPSLKITPPHKIFFMNLRRKNGLWEISFGLENSNQVDILTS